MKRCTESFSIWRDGAPLAYTAGQLVEDKDPILKTHTHLFTDLEPTPRRAARVEATTAAPDELRDLTPPTTTTTDPTGSTENAAGGKQPDGDTPAQTAPARPRGRGKRTV